MLQLVDSLLFDLVLAMQVSKTSTLVTRRERNVVLHVVVVIVVMFFGIKLLSLLIGGLFK